MSKEELEAATRFRHFNWEKAKAFYYVTKLGSFTKAGVFLNVSQSALSRNILEIENALGVNLFIREPRGVKLTRKGEELFSVVETMFLSMTDFTRKTHAESHHQKKRKIRIATTHAITAYILNTHILNYTQEHLELVFELISDDHMIDIVLNDVDIAIRPYDRQARGVHQDLLFTLEKRLYASPEYLKKFGEPKTLEDLKHHRIIAVAQPDILPFSDVNWILGLGLPEGHIHEPVFKTNTLECAVEASKKGLGIVGSYEELEIIKNSGLRNILPETTGQMMKEYFIYPKSLEQDQQIIELKNDLFEKLSNIS